MKQRYTEILPLINTTEVLEAFDIEHWSTGKNISEGWLGVQCPFCDDRSNHLGINLNSNAISCHRCGMSGTLYKLIMKKARVPLNQAYNIFLKYLSDDKHRPEIMSSGVECKLPPECTDKFSQKYEKFFIKRGFRNYQAIIEQYKLKATLPCGEHRHSIIIPYYLNYQLVSFVARRLSDEGVKYVNCPNQKSLVGVKETIYNIDTISEKLLIVEGIIDVWRMGNGCVATNGTKVSQSQINLLINRGVKECFIMFDSDATTQAENLAHNLTPFINHVEIIELSEGDPADLPENEVETIRKEIFKN